MTVETFTIYPTSKFNRPWPPSPLMLHNMDFCPPIQIHNHRFYHSQISAFPKMIETLRSSLAEALELYPPISGTVMTSDTGDMYIAMDAENRLGTPFLVDTKDTPYTGDAEDLSPRTDMMLPPSSSIFAVKVTLFSCGTIAVASSMNHQVADLRGFLDFLELWALLARGETVDLTKIPEHWTRNPSRFFPSKPSVSAPPPPFELLSTPASGPPAFFFQPSEVTRWRITKSSTDQLKRDFSPSSTNEQKPDQWISSGDALATLVSGAITRARHNAGVERLEGRSSVESQIEKIAMAADGRDRAPQGNMSGGQYFGNFNCLWSTNISRADLLSTSCDSASRVALSIRKALQQELSPEAIANKIAFFESPENNTPRGRITWSSDITLTNWCRFDLRGPKLDFGWGRPFSSTSGGVTVYPPGYCIMTQDKESGDVTLLITVEKEGGDVLKSDSVLNTYATLLPAHTSV